MRCGGRLVPTPVPTTQARGGRRARAPATPRHVPRWVAQLPELFIFSADDNPWQFPPRSVVKSVSSDEGKDMAPLRRYFEAVEKHDTSTSRRAKLVLVGTGRAGKSSTLRGMNKETLNNDLIHPPKSSANEFKNSFAEP